MGGQAISQITKPQIIALRTAASKVFGPCTCGRSTSTRDCDYHEWLAEAFGGISSTKDLSKAQAGRAIDALSERSRPAQSNKKRPRRRPSSEPWRGRYFGGGSTGQHPNLTQAQADEVARLEDALGWTGQPERLIGFIHRQTGLNKSVPMLKRKEAQSVVTGLRRLLTHQRNNAS